ncbi:MAG: hypothetical protein LC122_15625 [Chitinophagales bacterium]|nr:hypothetical protein [Chitinophagales bacterium]
MARIAGVKTTKNARGKLTHVTIDVRKHPQAIGTLKEMGLLNKSQFEKECEEAISLEEARTLAIKNLREIWKK